MKRLLIIPLILITTTAICQTVSFAPYSAKLWGQTPQTATISAEYENFGLHIFAPRGRHVNDQGNEMELSFAASYKKPILQKVLKAGVMVFSRPFPTDSDYQVNFIIDAGYTFNGVRLSYVHISNLGLGKYNTGFDTFQVTFPLF